MKFTAFVLATAAVSASAQLGFNPFAQNTNQQFNQQFAFQPYQLQQPYQVQQVQQIQQVVDPLAWERDCTWINSVNFRSLLSMATCGSFACTAAPNGNGGGHSRVANAGTDAYHVWGSVVNRAGRVCAVAYTGADLTRQFPYGRILSMKLANTANSLSLPTRAAPSHIRHSYPNNNRGLIMSGSGNAQYSASLGGFRLNSDLELDEYDFAQFKNNGVAQNAFGNQPNGDSQFQPVPPVGGQGSGYFAESQWFGFTLPAEQFNPGNVDVLYQGATSNYGEACGTTRQDSMCMQKPGGFTYQAGGLPLYDQGGILRGAIGVSGDNDCTNHAIAWKARQQMSLHYTPCEVAAASRNDAAALVANTANVLWAGKKAEDNVIFSAREQYLFPGCQAVVRQFATTNPTLPSTFGTGACTKA